MTSTKLDLSTRALQSWPRKMWLSRVFESLNHTKFVLVKTKYLFQIEVFNLSITCVFFNTHLWASTKFQVLCQGRGDEAVEKNMRAKYHFPTSMGHKLRCWLLPHIGRNLGRQVILRIAGGSVNFSNYTAKQSGKIQHKSIFIYGVQ